MKNLIKASFVLILFSTSVLLFQASCQKELDAQTRKPSLQKGKLVYSRTLTSSYAHIWEIKVKESEAIRAGQVIGISGNSETSTGPHLHSRIHDTNTAIK